MNNRKKYTIHANCQAVMIALFLEQHPEFCKEYEYVPLPSQAYSLTSQDAESVYKIVNESDLFIHQIISERLGLFSSDNIRSKTNDSAKCISVSKAYFAGYTPELCNIIKPCPFKNENNQARYNYQDIKILCAFLKGYSQNDTIQMLKADNLGEEYDRLARRNIEYSLNELRKREDSVDIKLTEFIASRYKEERLFHSMNHPTSSVMVHLVNMILERLGFASLAGNTAKRFANLGNNVVTYIHPSIRSLFNMDSTYYQNIRIYHQEHTLREYVAKYFTAYREDPDSAAASLARLLASDNIIHATMAKGVI